MNPVISRGSPNSAACSAALDFAVWGARLPINPPTTGIKISAINRDADRVRITVIGRNFINSPTMPDQNRSGKKTDSVVAEVALSCSCGHNYDWCGSGAGEGSIPNVLNLACLSTPDVELTAMNNLFRAMGAGRVSSAHAGVKAGAAMERAVNGADRE